MKNEEGMVLHDRQTKPGVSSSPGIGTGVGQDDEIKQLWLQCDYCQRWVQEDEHGYTKSVVASIDRYQCPTCIAQLGQKTDQPSAMLPNNDSHGNSGDDELWLQCDFCKKWLAESEHLYSVSEVDSIDRYQCPACVNRLGSRTNQRPPKKAASYVDAAGIAAAQRIDDTIAKLQLERLIQASGKMVLLDKLLPKLKQEGHKVLVFSQMVRQLDLLEVYLDHKRIGYERIDGSVQGNKRQAAIDRFSRPDSRSFVFLLSTRAGGEGINLMAADTVIIFDSDWNPQQDLQAQARVHRIGQTRHVQVYRLVTKGTYEAQMLLRASRKLGLEQAVLSHYMVSGDAPKTAADRRRYADDLEKILREGAYAMFDQECEKRAREFGEADIETILAKNTRVVDMTKSTGGDGDQRRSAVLTHGTVNKTSFTMRDGAGAAKVDLDDPEFWQKVLPDFANADRLHHRLCETGDAAKGGAGVRETFMEHMGQLVDILLRRRKEGDLVAVDDDHDFVTALKTLTRLANTHTFFPKEMARKHKEKLSDRDHGMGDGDASSAGEISSEKRVSGRKRKMSVRAKSIASANHTTDLEDGQQHKDGVAGATASGKGSRGRGYRFSDAQREQARQWMRALNATRGRRCKQQQMQQRPAGPTGSPAASGSTNREKKKYTKKKKRKEVVKNKRKRELSQDVDGAAKMVFHSGARKTFAEHFRVPWSRQAWPSGAQHPLVLIYTCAMVSFL